VGGRGVKQELMVGEMVSPPYPWVPYPESTNSGSKVFEIKIC
jgi:hypothetical protein